MTVPLELGTPQAADLDILPPKQGPEVVAEGAKIADASTWAEGEIPALIEGAIWHPLLL